MARNADDVSTDGGKQPSEHESVVSVVKAIIGVVQNMTRRYAAQLVGNQLDCIRWWLSEAADIFYRGFLGVNPLNRDVLGLLKEIERDLSTGREPTLWLKIIPTF